MDFEEYFDFPELQKSYVKSPHMSYMQWATNVEKNWHQYGCLQWTLQRAGKLKDNLTDNILLRQHCVNHLLYCLALSYDYCDFKEKWYGQQDHIPWCQKCFKEILACESEKYCARCYRSLLNGWRPI